MYVRIIFIAAFFSEFLNFLNPHFFLFSAILVDGKTYEVHICKTDANVQAALQFNFEYANRSKNLKQTIFFWQTLPPVCPRAL